MPKPNSKYAEKQRQGRTGHSPDPTQSQDRQISTVAETALGRIVHVTRGEAEDFFVVHLWDRPDHLQFTIGGVYDDRGAA
jgi:hypothetical protein